ncbi:hypothetical protein Tco_0211896 [Tanacetum coccineum]
MSCSKCRLENVWYALGRKENYHLDLLDLFEIIKKVGIVSYRVIHDQGSSKKGQSEVSTARTTQGTASEVPIVSTAEVNISTASEIRSTAGRIVYSRRSKETRKSSEEKRKDKGKAIMTEPEPKKKSNKELEQEILSIAEAIRLQEQIDEEQRAQIARDEEIARQYHTLKLKPKTVAQARKNMIKYLKNQGNYNIKDFKGMSYNEIRLILEKVWDFNQHIKPLDSEHEKEEVKPEQVVKEVSKKPGGRRRKILARKRTKDAQDKEISKRQKLDEEEEYDQEDENITYEGQMSSYYIIRADGKSKRYSTMTLLFQDIDREDLKNL